MRFGNLVSHNRTRGKTKKCTKREMLGVTWTDIKRGTGVTEQTKADVLTTIKKETWAGHTIRRTDSRCTKRETEWRQSRNLEEKPSQRNWWRDEIGVVERARWSALAVEKCARGWERLFSDNGLVLTDEEFPERPNMLKNL